MSIVAGVRASVQVNAPAVLMQKSANGHEVVVSNVARVVNVRRVCIMYVYVFSRWQRLFYPDILQTEATLLQKTLMELIRVNDALP